MNDLKTLFRVAEMDDSVPILDLHGKTVEEARQEIDYFLSDLVTKGVRIGKVIHGKGKERLLKEVPLILKGHRFIEAVHNPGGTYETGAVVYVSVDI